MCNRKNLGCGGLLGVPLEEDKCDGLCTLLEYLKFLLDTYKREAEQINRPNTVLEQSQDLHQTDLDSLTGQLQHASAVVKPG